MRSETKGESDSAAVKLKVLNTSGLAEADWLTLSEILLSLTADGKTWFDITDGEADVLRVLANQEENKLAKIQAQNVLHLGFGDTFPVIIDDEEIYLRQMQKPQEDTKFVIENDNLQLHPNPADESINIDYSIKSTGILKICDLKGVVLKTLKLESDFNSLFISITDLAPGMYFVEMSSKDSKLTQKLSIQR